MPILLVVNNQENWPVHIPGVEVVAARQYLTDPKYNALKNTRVFNLCRSYAYQSLGYYVSLLAEARRHHPQPDIVTIQDLRSATLSRAVADDLDQLMQRTLRPIKSNEFTLSIYFGRTLAERDRALGLKLFGRFQCPMLRVTFVKKHTWQLQSIRAISGSEIPDSHRPAVIEAATEYFRRRQWSGRATKPYRYHLAILVDPTEEHPPSDEPAIRKFREAAERAEVGTELITRDDFGRLGEFDALFIRTTTAVNHYTYRFARRAEAERMAVMDDPTSIARCCNKVFLAECLTMHKVPIPPTMIVHKDNADQIAKELGLPCVLKQPDSAFSIGVVKAETPEDLAQKVEELLDNSDLIIAQGFVPTDFDWRVGVLDGQAIYACQYFMARKHWQIRRDTEDGKDDWGRTITMPVEQAPPKVIATAVKAARLMGDGLYGVDLKQIGSKVVVMEVNDNPSLDAGFEDGHLKDELYDRIIQSFVRRIEALRAAAGNGTKRTRGKASVPTV